MMKKFAVIAIAFAATIGITFGAMLDKPFGAYSLVTTNSSSSAYVVRGEVAGVYVDVPSTKTGVVTVTTSYGQTLLSATVGADTYFPVRAQVYSTSGAALSSSGVGFTNAVYDRIGVAGVVTTRVAGADNTTGTNSFSVRVIFNQ